MKSQILLLAVTVAALSSCTTAYKTGQTPDDVYFSPARPQEEYVQVEKRDNRRYQSREEYYDDRYLRMRMGNRLRWSELDEDQNPLRDEILRSRRSPGTMGRAP